MESQTETYNPAEDENQGVVSTMARNSGAGEAQEPAMSPSAMMPSPDPDLTEADVDADNGELMIEEDVEDGEAEIDGDDFISE